MAASEDDIIRDQSERDNLQRVIASAESAMADSAPGTGTRRVLENLVEQAKKRVTVLDRKIEEAKVERRAEEQAQMTAAAALAAKETALNVREREEYGGFLKEGFFTKQDFGKLARFYAHSYDRLSEGGKEEMSHRVWEGIRHGEYQFGDLPQEVQQKETGQVRKRLGLNDLNASSLATLPNEDQHAFANAYKKGNNDDALHILTQDSTRQDDRKALLNRSQTPAKGNNSDSEKSSKTSQGAEKLNLKSLNLDGLEFGETETVAKPIVAALAGSTTAKRQC